MTDDRKDLSCRLALAFVTEAVGMSLSERPWARLNDTQVLRYVQASDGQLQRCMAERAFEEGAARHRHVPQAAFELAAAQ